MNPHRRTVALAGILFFLGTATGVTSAALTDPILGDPDRLLRIAENPTPIFVGALLVLAMGLSLSGMAIALYPVLSRVDPRVAVGYLAARLVEFVIFIIGVVALLSLVTLGREQAEASGGADHDLLARLLLESRDWVGHVVLDVAVFPIGALLLYSVLYRARFVPRWLAGWGIAGAVLYWAAGFLILFDLIAPFTGPHIVLQAPLGIQELVLAFWMIAKGFDMSGLRGSPEVGGDEDDVP